MRFGFRVLGFSLGFWAKGFGISLSFFGFRFSGRALWFWDFALGFGCSALGFGVGFWV